MKKAAGRVVRALRERNSSAIKLSLAAFLSYLETLTVQICPSGLKPIFIYQWTFKNEVTSAEDLKTYHKANLFSAKESLHRIIPKVEKDGINEVTNRMLMDFVCDLESSINCFDANHDYSWLAGNTNLQISNFYNDLSENIFWLGAPGLHPQGKLVLAASVPFVIRQSIEYKIKRILGIDYILVDGRPDLQTMNRCFKTIENNMAYYITKLDFGLLKQIHSWTHPYIHGGYRAAPWKTETALHCLKSLFYAGQTSNPNSFSWYAAVEVDDFNMNVLRQNTELSLKAQCEGDLTIKWLAGPEVAVIKKPGGEYVPSQRLD